ncbi:hypothetical protein B0T19DRAFT_248151 [Cercophora scortea]|uniref:Uncharacterized protein n=1 Tax=Cercophora scortea TaxID=314031 RepID=A0AAE0I8X9_9PEZI|nr:hypothetical protein B0T19DRAFT_248151 [Cercophora scortea]
MIIKNSGLTEVGGPAYKERISLGVLDGAKGPADFRSQIRAKWKEKGQRVSPLYIYSIHDCSRSPLAVLPRSWSGSGSVRSGHDFHPGPRRAPLLPASHHLLDSSAKGSHNGSGTYSVRDPPLTREEEAQGERRGRHEGGPSRKGVVGVEVSVRIRPGFLGHAECYLGFHYSRYQAGRRIGESYLTPGSARRLPTTRLTKGPDPGDAR